MTPPSPLSNAIHVNLGTVGPIPWYYARRFGLREHLSGRDQQAVIADAHEGLPRPGWDLDGQLLETQFDPQLLVLAGRKHGFAYYVILNLAERATWKATHHWLQKGLVHLCLADKDIGMTNTRLFFDERTASQLERALETQKDAWRQPDDSWRDRFGMLLLTLPGAYASADPHAAFCTHHCVVLASGHRASHLNRIARAANEGPGRDTGIS